MQEIDLTLTSDQVQRLDKELDACVRRLDDLNARFPNLASDISKQAVEHWRARQAWVQDQKGKRSEVEPGTELIDVKHLAIRLLSDNDLEGVLDILLRQHEVELTVTELVDLIGHENYATALRKDVEFLMDNAVSYEQIAKLWKDLGRPVSEGSEWNAHNISALIG